MLCSVWQVWRDLSLPCADCDTSWQFTSSSTLLSHSVEYYCYIRTSSSYCPWALLWLCSPAFSFSLGGTLVLPSPSVYALYRRLEARAEWPTQWKTCVCDSYPLVRESLQELFGVRGSQQVEETAADSLVFPHFTLSSFLSLCVIAAASCRVYLITVYWPCLIALLPSPCN